MARFKNTSQCWNIKTDDGIVASCFDTSDMVQCTDAFGYRQQRNYSEFWSLKSEKQWLCDDSDLAANVYSAKMAGQVVWMIILMQMIDK